MAETDPKHLPAIDYITMSKNFVPVQIESPVNAPTQEGIDENLAYLRRCILDCIKRGESPYASAQMLASHPSLLNDLDPELRTQGISAGFTFIPLTKKSVVYTDRGISRGMKAGIAYAEILGHPVEYRRLDNDCTYPEFPKK